MQVGSLGLLDIHVPSISSIEKFVMSNQDNLSFVCCTRFAGLLLDVHWTHGAKGANGVGKLFGYIG